MESNDLKRAVEALLFASERPLTVSEIGQAFEEGVSAQDIQQALDVLRDDYQAQRRGFRLIAIAGGFQIATDPALGTYLKRFYQSREKKKLSSASLETLSVIAYKQPVAKADIEFVRGVNVDGALKSLMEKDLVRVTGRKDVPGRPMLYGTTPFFLDRFGLNSLQDLPPLTTFSAKDINGFQLPEENKTETV
ncbi:MAG: SMC-Scp complex subunit ScpB [Candidatus Omnitrophica bacterium]|nr:SMC-Scp complex subunit ScpB [Candidatus Omnitrophota bacterium]